MATINQRLGDRIKKLRKQAGLSQEDLAVLAKVDLISINEIETGHRNPSLRTIHKIALALKIETKDIFDF